MVLQLQEDIQKMSAYICVSGVPKTTLRGTDSLQRLPEPRKAICLKVSVCYMKQYRWTLVKKKGNQGSIQKTQVYNCFL